jgi:hypothetical protein
MYQKIMKMNQNTKTILAISIATVFSLSVVAINGIPQATAEKFKNPDFESDDCIVTGFGEDLEEQTGEKLNCKMQAWLQEKGKHLKYQIKISGMELKDTNSDSVDDVDGMHIHKMTNDDVTNPKGPHQLNIFGHPGVDDSSNVAISKKGIGQGLWDDKDETLSYGEPDNSHKLSENLGLLCEGKAFSAIHGQNEDRPGHNAPYMKIVFEPTEKGLQLCEKLGY